jgi:hypothetical protein
MTLPRHPVVFLKEGAAPPPGAIAIDAACPDVALDLSHWRAGNVPASLIGDTGFELAWQARQQGLLEPLFGAPLVNDHVDADGLLSAAALSWPDEVMSPATVAMLRRAAACGDFTEWHGSEALALVLTLHEWIDEAQAAGGAWEQAVYQRVQEGWQACLEAVRQPSDAVQSMLQQVEVRRRELSSRVQLLSLPGWAVAFWHEEHGHRTDVYGAVHWQDDVPLWLLDVALPRAALQYSAWRTAAGWQHMIEAPRYSWAITKIRPMIHQEPEWDAICSRLNDLEQSEVEWSQTTAAESAFTGRLCAMDQKRDIGSCLAPTQVLDVLQGFEFVNGVR